MGLSELISGLRRVPRDNKVAGGSEVRPTVSVATRAREHLSRSEELTADQLATLDQALIDGFEIAISKAPGSSGSRVVRIALQGMRQAKFDGRGMNLETALSNAAHAMKDPAVEDTMQQKYVRGGMSAHLARLDSIIANREVGVVLRRYSEIDPVVLSVGGAEVYRGGNDISETLNVFCNANQFIELFPKRTDQINRDLQV